MSAMGSLTERRLARLWSPTADGQLTAHPRPVVLIASGGASPPLMCALIFRQSGALRPAPGSRGVQAGRRDWGRRAVEHPDVPACGRAVRLQRLSHMDTLDWIGCAVLCQERIYAG